MSSSLCTSCAPSSKTSLYLMQNNSCVSSCSTGKTPVGSQCVPCNSPCGTCDIGFPNACTSCSGLTPAQFLFGRECVSQCPNGTSLNYGNRSCDGCLSQCTQCDNANNAICLECIPGLILFNKSCILQCPIDYVQSADGSTCQLKPYLLDGSLVYFPFATAAGILLLISVMSSAVTCGKSMLLTNSVALLSLVEVAAVAMVFYEAF